MDDQMRISCLICVVTFTLLYSAPFHFNFSKWRVTSSALVDDSRFKKTLTDNRNQPVVEESKFILNATWLLERRHLAKVKKKRNIIKVAVVAYMRSGSTLLSRLFADIERDRSLYWFEPLMPYITAKTGLFTSQIIVKTDKKRILDEMRPTADQTAELLAMLYNCEWDRLPIEMFSQPNAMNGHALDMVYSCISNRTGLSAPLLHCLSNVFAICNNMVDESIMTRCSTVIRAFRDINITDVHPPLNDLDNVTRNSLNDLDLHRRRHRPVEFIVNGMYEVPFEMSSLDRILAHRRCLNELSVTSRRHRCLDNMRELLHRHESNGIPLFVIVKMIRARLSDTESSLRQFPDLSVVHLVRDPRAVAVSQYNSIATWHEFHPNYINFGLLQKSKIRLARRLCDRMSEDLQARRNLEKVFPGAIITVRYEDFVRSPRETARRLYHHIGHEIDDVQLNEWIDKYLSVNDNRQDGSPFEIVRKKPLSHLYSWKNYINGTEMSLMNDYCKLVLEKLNYQP